MSSAGAGRSFPVQYCPYCGEQDLRPEPEPPGAWSCADCRSTFVVSRSSRSTVATGASR